MLCWFLIFVNIPSWKLVNFHTAEFQTWKAVLWYQWTSICTYTVTVLHNVDPLFFSLLLVTHSPGLHRYTFLALHCFTGAGWGWRLRGFSMTCTAVSFWTTCTTHSNIWWIDESTSWTRPARIHNTRTLEVGYWTYYNNIKTNIKLIFLSLNSSRNKLLVSVCLRRQGSRELVILWS